MIPYGRQSISDADVAAVVSALRSDFLTQGPAIERFERSVAEACEASHAVAVANATAGLHLACQAVDLGPGDSLWTSPNTFLASANCGRYCGANVDFVDIDRRTYNLDAAALAKKLENTPPERRPKVVVPVHFAGQSPDMVEIARLGKLYNFRIIEDASHAIGARYRGRPVGNGEFSDLTVFSFHPVKIITTGEGGMVMTRDSGLAARVARLRSHGIVRDPAAMTEATHGPWYYQQQELGWNYRMTDLQAALGSSQMGRLGEFIRRRRALAARYDQLLADLPLKLPWQHPDTESAFHLYVIRLRLDSIRKTHRQVFEELRKEGIGVQLHYIPVPLQPYYRDLGQQGTDYPEALEYYAEAISLPMFPALTDRMQDEVVSVLREILTGAATGG